MEADNSEQIRVTVETITKLRLTYTLDGPHAKVKDLQNKFVRDQKWSQDQAKFLKFAFNGQPMETDKELSNWPLCYQNQAKGAKIIVMMDMKAGSL
jgi:hypothetical protein